MQATPHPRLAGVLLLQGHVAADARGYFRRWMDIEALGGAQRAPRWVQGNQSLSQRGVVRGLHFQRPPHAETKLVAASTGRVFDVFVDLRAGSPTWGEWGSVELSAAAGNAVLIPRGFAHGFCALEDQTLLTYLVDAPYAPGAEGGVRWDDPTLAIAWPVHGAPLLSPKDAALPALSRELHSLAVEG